MKNLDINIVTLSPQPANLTYGIMENQQQQAPQVGWLQQVKLECEVLFRPAYDHPEASLQRLSPAAE